MKKLLVSILVVLGVCITVRDQTGLTPNKEAQEIVGCMSEANAAGILTMMQGAEFVSIGNMTYRQYEGHIYVRCPPKVCKDALIIHVIPLQ